MVSGQSKGADAFLKNREQARSHDLPQSIHSQAPPVPAHCLKQQGPNFPPNGDIALRRQQRNRQELGEELKIVGPPAIYNPDELPLKKRSAISMIEKAKSNVFPISPAGGIAGLASHVASHQTVLPKPERGTFDDSESIRTTDTDYVDHDEIYKHHPIAIATDYNKRNPASNPNLKYVSIDHANQMRGQIIGEEEDEYYGEEEYARERAHNIGALFPGWQDEVAEERAIRGVTPTCAGQYQGPGNYAGPTQYEQQNQGPENYAGPTQYDQPGFPESSVDFNDDYGDIENHEFQGGRSHEIVDEADAGARTPTQPTSRTDQAKHIPQASSGGVLDDLVGEGTVHRASSKARATNTGFAGTAVEGGRIVNTANPVHKNTATNNMAPPPKPAPVTKKVDKGKQIIRENEFDVPMSSVTPPDTLNKTKATSFGSSSPSQASEDELTLPNATTQASHKRSFEESLDYTRDQLAGMSYADLDNKPFLADPNPPREAASEHQGAEPTLEQRLSNMTDVTEDECKAMFAAMTDAENEGTGEWFMVKMKEDMEALMRAKHRRRMIALKYEHEIKKRNAMVKRKTTDVDDELEGLKNGLGSLMPKDKKEQREAAKAEKKAARKAGKSGL